MNSFETDDERTTSLDRHFEVKLEVTMVINRLPPSPRFLQPDSAAVFDIRVVNVTTTEMGLEWQSIDNASGYIYHLQLESKHSSNQTNSSYKAITLRGLIPGTLYNITIVPEVNGVWGISNFTAQYTRKCLRTPSEREYLPDFHLEGGK